MIAGTTPVRISESDASQREFMFRLVDETDGYTPEVGITLSGSDIQIRKAGGAFANFAGTATELTGSDGLWKYVATTGELDTPGRWDFKVEKAGCRLVAMTPFHVLPLTAVSDIADAVDAALADGVLVAAVDTDAIVAASLATAAYDAIAESVWSASIESGISAAGMLRGIMSGVLGHVRGFLSGVLSFRSLDDTKLRATVQTNADGRQVVTPGDFS